MSDLFRYVRCDKKKCCDVARKKGISAQHQPASSERIRTDSSMDELRAFCVTAKDINPKNR